jgi:hypothetical protein
MVSLDEYLDDTIVDFVKIDVEGFEYGVLKGMMVILDTQYPIVMLEVQASEIDIFTLFTERNYQFFSESRTLAPSAKDMKNNIFFLHREKHAKQIALLVAHSRVKDT